MKAYFGLVLARTYVKPFNECFPVKPASIDWLYVPIYRYFHRQRMNHWFAWPISCMRWRWTTSWTIRWPTWILQGVSSKNWPPLPTVSASTATSSNSESSWTSPAKQCPARYLAPIPTLPETRTGRVLWTPSRPTRCRTNFWTRKSWSWTSWDSRQQTESRNYLCKRLLLLFRGVDGIKRTVTTKFGHNMSSYAWFSLSFIGHILASFNIRHNWV